MAGTERTAYSTTQTLGLGLISAALLVVVILTLVLFEGEGIGFFGSVTAAVLVSTFLAWRFDAIWARIVGLLGTLVALIVFFLFFGIFQPLSPIEFIVGLLYTFGFFVSLIGGIMAIVAGVRGREGPTRGEARTRTWVLGLIAFGAVFSIVGLFLTRTSVSEAEASGATVIEMTNFEFEPDPASAQDGKLLVTNRDLFVHDFTLVALDIEVTLGPTSETLIDLSAAASDTYNYFCSLHEDMTGTLTIGS